MVHGELLSAAPFASHNGLVARATERLVLVARGLDEKSLVVPEAGHLALRPAYEGNLGGLRDGGPGGVHRWLLYAAEAYAAGDRGEPDPDTRGLNVRTCERHPTRDELGAAADT